MEPALQLIHSSPVILYHGFQGDVKQHFEEMIDKFNRDPDNVRNRFTVQLIHFEGYDRLVEMGLEQFTINAHNAPNIIQASEFQTEYMMRQRLRPVNKLLNNKTLDDIEELMRKTFADSEGKLLSLPISPSSGVLYYNNSVLAHLGFPDKSQLENFEGLNRLAQRVVDEKTVTRVEFGWTSASIASYLVEVRKAQQGQLIAFPKNCLDGYFNHFCFNTPEDVAFFKQLKQWQKAGAYRFVQSQSDAQNAFCAGKCAFLLQSVRNYYNIKDKVTFNLGVAPIPSYGDQKKQAFSLEATSLWVLDNIQDKVEAVKAVLNFLASPEVQTEWHQKTGYLPVSKAVVNELMKKKSVDQEIKRHKKLALEQTFRSPSGELSLGNRIPHYQLIRNEIIRTITAFFNSDEEDPKPFLDKLNQTASEISKTSYDISTS